MGRISRLALLLVLFLGGCELFETESKNARLSELTVSGGDLSPAFASSTLQYSVTVDAATASTTVSAKSKDNDAKVSINGGDRGRSVTAVVALAVGANEISVEVKAESGRKKTYTIDVTRPAPTYSIGGSISGLTGSLTLQNNGGDDLTITVDGPYTFATRLADGSNYDVAVSSQPAGQNCTVANGTGVLAGANVSNVDITCVPLTFTVGGQLNGLTDSVTLQNNGGDDLVLTADGDFTFATALNNGAGYDVTVSSQPAGQSCTVTNGAGMISGANVTNVAVDCSDAGTFAIAGTINGLAGNVALQLNGTDDLLGVKNGTFVFLRRFADGVAYDVTVTEQPVGQNCTVTNGSGNIAGNHVVDVVVDCTGVGTASGSIFEWNWVNPMPQGNSIADFATDGAQVVAVGGFGLVQTSPDGLNWTTRDPGTGDSLQAVTWGDGEFVAVGSSGIIVASADGVSWQTRNRGFYTFFDIVWNGSVYVAVGSDDVSGKGLIATSADAVAWSLQTIDVGEFNNILSIAWNGSLFAAIGYSASASDIQAYVYTSADAATWSTAALGGPNVFFDSIASDGNRFVTVGIGGIVQTSMDGITWTEEASPFPLSSTSSLSWDGTRFVGPSFDGYAVSADGTSWTAYALGDPSELELFISMIRFGGLNIIGTNEGAVHSSPDDTSWTTPFTSDGETLWDVIWDGGQFVAVGSGPVIQTSPDGIVWTTRYDAGAIVAIPQRIIFAGGQYVVVGNGSESQVLTSPDAITWTSHSPSMNNLSLSGVAYGDNQYIAVGNLGTVLNSADGSTWTAQATGFDGNEQLYDIAWNGSVWAVSGFYFSSIDDFGSFIATSTDGIAWTKQAFPDLLQARGLEWNGSLFVAVGTAIITSADGMSWTSFQTNASLDEITWTGSEFIAIGFGAEVLRSADGLTWMAERSISGNYSGVASDGTRTVVISASGGHKLTHIPP